jgi:hypothetical protein
VRTAWTPPPRAWGPTDVKGVAGIGDRFSCNLLADAIGTAQVDAVADAGYQGAGLSVRVRQRRRRLASDTGRYRWLSQNQKDVDTAPARQRV